MFALVGLGNPGAQYQDNRHNVGFMALDAIASQAGLPPFQKKGKALFTAGKIGSHSLLLIKPQSFMNVSGPPLVPFLMFHKIPPAQCLVFHDELDLPLCKVRVKTGGGNGGHNGLRSLDQHIGNGYQRVRIGIDKPVRKEMVSGYVLSDFTQEERPLVDDLLKAIAENLSLLLEQDPGLFMTRLSPFGPQPTPPEKETPHGI
jgi:PTH1 family peptidyl-tRNA hydrolase